MKLNGWQRLWVFVMLASGSIVAWDAVESYPTESELFNSWSYDGLRWIQVHVQGKTPERHISMGDVRPENKSDKEIVEMLRRYPQEKAGGTDKDAAFLADNISKANKRFEIELNALPAKQAGFVRERLVGWIGTGAVLYGLGLAFAWIRRGFKADGSGRAGK
ncbi:hypothetical protein D3C84_571980 [compost metagenome]